MLAVIASFSPGLLHMRLQLPAFIALCLCSLPPLCLRVAPKQWRGALRETYPLVRSGSSVAVCNHPHGFRDTSHKHVRCFYFVFHHKGVWSCGFWPLIVFMDLQRRTSYIFGTYIKQNELPCGDVGGASPPSPLDSPAAHWGLPQAARLRPALF